VAIESLKLALYVISRSVNNENSLILLPAFQDKIFSGMQSFVIISESTIKIVMPVPHTQSDTLAGFRVYQELYIFK
jgi:hypothetical protein